MAGTRLQAHQHKSASLDEVKAVTGHEIGHHVLGHVWRIVIVASSLPVLPFIISVLGLLAQPMFNTLSRIDENEADAYSLETVNLPDALASALVKVAEYRYPRPGALQEFIFYTRPSVERRVRR